MMEPIEIIITKRSDDYHAQVKGKPEIWACNESYYMVLGNLISDRREIFNIKIVWDVENLGDKIEPVYCQSDKYLDRIDWENIMPMPRYAGGHDDQMRGLFKNVTVLGHWNESDYQGKVATCVQFNDTGEVVIYNDYYGSCSGCDAWEDATDTDVKDLCIQLAAGAYIFKTLEDCIGFLKYPDKEISFDWCYDNTAKNLLNAIKNREV